MCCLRLPALEAASASAIESMLCGKATIVMDTGFYSELPDAYVRKISPENEIAGLEAVLENLCADKTQRLLLGQSAATWARQHFNGDKYADGLLLICESTARAIPVTKMSCFYSDVLGKWGAPLHGETVLNILEPISKLIDE